MNFQKLGILDFIILSFIRIERSVFIMINSRQPLHTTNPRNTRAYNAMQMSSEMLNLESMPLAMAYVPWQRWNNVYDLDRALQVGTIFPELDLPFLGMRGGKS
jgi:hypothetical protein